MKAQYLGAYTVEPRPPHGPWWVPFFVLLLIAIVLVAYT